MSLIKANLLEEGSFDSAIEGCVGVFHTASPVSFDVKDPQVHACTYITIYIFLEKQG